jgi:hypothetical protein
MDEDVRHRTKGPFQSRLALGIHSRPTTAAPAKYAASDHAVSEEQYADYTVLMPVGVDSKGDI